MNTDIQVHAVKKVVRRNIAKIAMDILARSKPEIIQALINADKIATEAEQMLREARDEQAQLLNLA